MARRLQIADLAHMTSFGTFKPTGHAVLAYADEGAARAARDRLVERGIHEECVLVASSGELFPHVDRHMAEATNMAGAQGYEVLLMKRYLDLAARDAWRLIVKSPSEEDVSMIKGLLDQPRPLSGAHYGRLLIEDLSEPLPSTPSAVDQAAAASARQSG